MRKLTPGQEARWLLISAAAIVAITALGVREKFDFTDTGVVVIFIVSMLLLSAAIRHYIAKSTDDDGRSDLEKRFKFFQRIFPPHK